MRIIVVIALLLCFVGAAAVAAPQRAFVLSAADIAKVGQIAFQRAQEPPRLFELTPAQVKKADSALAAWMKKSAGKDDGNTQLGAALGDYYKVYQGVTKPDGKRKVRIKAYAPSIVESMGREITALGLLLMMVADGGCSVVNMEIDVDSGNVDFLHCNGTA